MNKKIAKVILFSGVSFFILYFLLRNIDIANLSMAFNNFNWRFSVLAFLAYLGIHIFRALRFDYFFKNRVGFSRFLKIVFLYNFWNQILPFRSGELSYLYLVKKNSKKILMGENIASLVAARIFDTFILALFVLFAAYFIFNNLGADFVLSTRLLVGFAVVFAVFIFVIFFNRKLVNIIDKITGKSRISKFRIIKVFFEKLKEAFLSISAVKSFPGFFVFFGYSVLILFFDFLTMWLMFNSAGLSVDFWRAAVIDAGLIFVIFVLPIQTPVNLGTYEGALVGLFLFFGFEKNLAIGASILIHLQNIVFAFIFFISAYLFWIKSVSVK